MADQVKLPQSLAQLGREFLKRANERHKGARRLLWSIVLLLAVGLLVVIFLPVGLSYLDRLLITGSPEDIIREKQLDITSLEQELKEIDGERTDLITRVNADLRLPGTVWISVALDLAGKLLEIETLTSGAVVAAGTTSDDKVLILRGSNDGQDWRPVGPDLAGTVYRIELLTSGVVLAAGRTSDDKVLILRSSNDGQDWTPVGPDLAGSVGGIEALTSGAVLATVRTGDDKVLILRSSNDGQDWTPVGPDLAGYINEIEALTSGAVIAVGQTGDDKVLILRGSNDGQDWTPVGPDLAGTVYRIEPLTSGAVLAFGRSGAGKLLILRGSNDGQDWTPVGGAGLAGSVGGIEALTSGAVLAVGTMPGILGIEVVILRGSNDGQDWTPVGPDLAGRLSGIVPLTSGAVLAAGRTGEGKVLILRGSNDGQDWTPVGPDVAGSVRRIDALTSGAVLAVGRTGNRSDPKVLILRGSPASELLPADLDLPGINGFFQRYRDLPIAESYQRNVIALSTRKLQIDERLPGLRVDLNTYRDAAAQSAQGDPWTKQLYIQGTRLTFIAILIYLVQIYVNLYRYNLRLAAYYRGRADALSILVIEKARVSPEEFSTLCAALSPEGMDFGKAATPPTQQVVQFTRDLLQSRPKS